MGSEMVIFTGYSLTFAHKSVGLKTAIFKGYSPDSVQTLMDSKTIISNG